MANQNGDVKANLDEALVVMLSARDAARRDCRNVAPTAALFGVTMFH
jgi:hypothetical protein